MNLFLILLVFLGASLAQNNKSNGFLDPPAKAKILRWDKEISYDNRGIYGYGFR